MERLTQWIDENTAIPRVDLRRCGHERCTTQLARYEDTCLTPEKIVELKERDWFRRPAGVQMMIRAQAEQIERGSDASDGT